MKDNLLDSSVDINPELKEKIKDAISFRDNLMVRYPEIFNDKESFISLDFKHTPQNQDVPAKFSFTVGYSKNFPTAIRKQFQEYLSNRFDKSTWSEFYL